MGKAICCVIRAGDQLALLERQEEHWQPLVAWIDAHHGLQFEITTGIVPVPQSPAMLQALCAILSSYDDYGLVGLHSATVGAGSVILGLALAATKLDAEAVWTLSRLDESFQMEQWGLDAEAEARRRALAAEMRATEVWFQALRA